MTLDEFYEKYKGTKVDDDGVFEYQCVDLIKKYAREVVGSPLWTGDPKTYIRNPEPNFYEYRFNSPMYIPPKGAIVIWNGNVGAGHGHVGIIAGAGLLQFSSFDQNWPVGSPAVLVQHSYQNVIGFLIPRKQDIASKYNELRGEIIKILERYPIQLT